MAEKRAEGAELGRMIKQAKKQPLAFAFCPGPTDEDDVLYIHRQKSPDILAKIARDESAGTKTAYGTLAVTGKMISLTCLRELPAMEKQLHRYMKRQKQPMEVRVQRETETDDQDVAELVSRLKAVQADLVDIDDAQADKLKTAIQGAVRLIKSGDLEKAASAIDIIEKAMDTAASASPVEKSEATKLADRITALRPQVDCYEGANSLTVNKALAAAGRLFKTGDLENAKLAADAVEKAVGAANRAFGTD